MSLYLFMEKDEVESKKLKNEIALIDADLLDRNARHPNLALMKISNYYKQKGFNTRLVLSYEEDFFNNPNTIFLSKVFTNTKIPFNVTDIPNLKNGGTGFKTSADLSNEIEHCFPDYDLYDEYVKYNVENLEKREKTFDAYKKFSIGFMTRGCFRKCEFCVNKKYDSVLKHSPLEEFFDNDRKYIRLWDDNILAYRKWDKVFEELNNTNKPFIFQQGLDIRMLTQRKVDTLLDSNYFDDRYIFAFDYIRDREIITKKLKLWAESYSATGRRGHGYWGKLYVFGGLDVGHEDLHSMLTRIKIIMEHGSIPYTMLFEKHTIRNRTKYGELYMAIKNWTNFVPSIMSTTLMESLSNEDRHSLKKQEVLFKLMKELENINPEFKELFNVSFKKNRKY